MRKLLSAVIPTVSFFMLAPAALAVDVCPPAQNADGSHNPYYDLCQISTGNFGAVIGPLIQLIFVIAIIVALLYLVWGGFKWLTSGGDKSAVAAAREHIVAALVGLVIIFLAYFILSILLAFFVPGVNFTNLTIPHISSVTGK